MDQLSRGTRPRVLQVVLSLHPGGTERLVVELATRLNAEIPMAVCCLEDAGAWARDLESRSIHVTALSRRPGFQPFLGRAVAAAAHEHRATILHAHHYSPFVYSCLARLWHRAEVVFTEHGRLSDAPPSGKRRLANQIFRTLPRAILAVSEDLKHHIVGEGFRAADVRVIYNGIDVGPLPDSDVRARVRSALGVAEQTTVLGTIARLDPVKDLSTLLTAIAQAGKTVPIVLVIVGDGPERRRLEEMALQLRIDSQIRFLGYRDDAREWLAGCDVYVNSSIHEGVSLTILEAMAAGLPIIATRVGGTPEVVDDSCGRLIPARDVGALTTAIVALARDSGLQRQFGEAARRRVESRFTLDRMVHEYRDVYLEALGYNRRPRGLRPTT